MSRRLLGILALAVAVGLVAFWGARLAVCSKSTRPPLCELGQGTHLQAELGLDERQAGEVRALERELAGQLSEQCGRYCAVRAALGEALLAEGPNAVAESRRLVGEMCAIQSASELATLEHIRKVSAVLTPGQRQKFLSGLTRCLCGTEGLCAGGCREGLKHE